ncbi:MAG: cyclic nucleotide-binding domain-containing protein [Verrucomicrobiota bacterium]
MSNILDQFKHLDAVQVKSGTEVITEGSDLNQLHVLAYGGVDIYKGETRVASANQPGSVFGEISVLLKTPCTATVKTTQDSTFYIVEQPDAFLQANPVVALHVSRLLAVRLNNLTQYLIDVKNQFEGDDHIGMVEDILNTLINRQPKEL